MERDAPRRCLGVAIALLLPTFGLGQVDHAYIEAECRNEISVMCNLETDIIGCLRRNKAGLMSDCREALKRGTRPPERPPAPVAAPAATASVEAPSRGPRQAAVIDGSYSGQSQEAFRELRRLLETELPGALREAAEGMGLPQYADGFAHPMKVRVVYEPTTQSWGSVEEPVHSGSEWTQSMALNLAYWEECRSKAVLRSLLRHELVHAILRDNAFDDPDRATFPSQWFDEGLATVVGGEPTMTQSFDASFKRLGGAYRNPACELRRLDEGAPFAPVECYPHFATAVKLVLRQSPNAVPKVMAGLRTGEPVEATVERETGMAWAPFKSRVQADIDEAFGKMGWWNRLRARWWQVFLCRE